MSFQIVAQLTKYPNLAIFFSFFVLNMYGNENLFQKSWIISYYFLLRAIWFYLLSGGGSMVGAISGSTQREPLVVGKPSTFMMDYLATK